MSTDDTGSWSRPNPTERTDPDFVDITRLAPASDEADQPADEALDEISDDDLVAVDVDDVDADDVDDDDIDAIMAGFERSKAADTSANEASAEASDSADATADEAPAATETGEVEPAPVAEAEPEPADATEPEPAAEPEPEPEPAVKGFAALGLRQELVDTLNDLGYEEPTPIQRETIPLLLTGRDMLGQAATGTGKTAAFALPALNAIEPGFPDAPSVLVLTPTRELAVQVSEAIVKYGKKLGAKVVPVFGGQPIGRQLGALDRGAHVVVATPGRAIDHIGRGSLRLDKIKTVILDEADEMLDMGFTDDIESILESTPTDRQTVMFSATMPPRIHSIAKRHQRNPEKIKIGKAETQESQKLIRQKVYFVKRNDKPYALGRILDIETPDAAIVFCRTRMDVDQLTATMGLRGYRAEALHGGMDQSQRDRVMARLRDGTAELLVATDVAARGLDVDTLTHVVNYDVPRSCRELRPPHWPCRSSRPRGHRNHAGRSARPPSAWQHRTPHEDDHRGRQGAKRGRPACPSGRGHRHPDP